MNNNRFYKNVYKCEKDNYLVPNVLDQNNIVHGNKVGHKWSNTIGYGNIRVSSINCSKKYPWNRIPPLTFPSSTPVNPRMAWNIK